MKKKGLMTDLAHRGSLHMFLHRLGIKSAKLFMFMLGDIHDSNFYKVQHNKQYEGILYPHPEELKRKAKVKSETKTK